MSLNWAGLADDLARRMKGPVWAGVPMAKHTTWRIGGPADLLAVPHSAAELKACLVWAREHDLPVVVIGNGSNLLVLDGGIRGLVIKTAHGLNQLEVKDGYLKLGAGVLLPAVLRLAARYGWQGLEFAAGIPATVGGAVIMNAGTREAAIGGIVRRVGLIDRDCEYVEMAAAEIDFGYRFSSLQKQAAVVTSVYLQIREGEPAAVARDIKDRIMNRKRQQPYRWPSAGSVFRNPAGAKPAGWLIEQVGGKGLRCGGAVVAQEHANFIINTDGARARDVLCLIEEIRRRVSASFGVDLEAEICILGETRG